MSCGIYGNHFLKIFWEEPLGEESLLTIEPIEDFLLMFEKEFLKLEERGEALPVLSLDFFRGVFSGLSSWEFCTWKS